MDESCCEHVASSGRCRAISIQFIMPLWNPEYSMVGTISAAFIVIEQMPMSLFLRAKTITSSAGLISIDTIGYFRPTFHVFNIRNMPSSISVSSSRSVLFHRAITPSSLPTTKPWANFFIVVAFNCSGSPSNRFVMIYTISLNFDTYISA